MQIIKKITALLLAFFLIAGNLPLQYLPDFLEGMFGSSGGVFDIEVSADYNDGIFTYVFTTDAKVRITGLNQNVSEIVIPYKIASYDVVEIGPYAFSYYTAITSVSMPGPIRLIDDYAFENCTGLKSVYLGTAPKTLGSYVFSGCTSLSSIVIPNSVTGIGSGAFLQTGIKTLALPEGLLTIGASAFEQCSSLTIASIPSTVTALPELLFSSCNNLVSVTVPNSVINFASNIFSSSPNVIIYGNTGSAISQYAAANSIPFIPAASYTVSFDANGGTPSTDITQNCGTVLTAPTVTRTGYNFSGWSPAVPIVMPNANTTYTAQWSAKEYLIIFDANGGTGGTNTYMDYGTALNPPIVSKPLYIFNGWSPAVPSTVPSQNTTYTAQWLPVYTYTIENGEVTITTCSVTVTGTIIIPSFFEGYPVKYIAESAFNGCVGITNLTIPASVVAIDIRAFYGCTGLTSISIPAGVAKIGNSAFQNCTNLADIDIPDSLTDIGYNAFNNTAWLNAKPDGLVYIGSLLYKYKGTMPASTVITVNPGTLGIAGGAFSRCAGLTEITLPESLTTIGYRTFFDCTGIASIIVLEGVAVIGEQAFAGCTALTIGCFPDSYAHLYANENEVPHAYVARITFNANGGTGGTSTVLFCGTVLTAPEVTKQSFIFGRWSPDLPALVPEANTTYTSEWLTVLAYTILHEEVTITGLNTELTGRLTIPDTIEGYPVRYIATDALKTVTGLTGVDFPAGLRAIGAQAFARCTGLTSITLPEGLVALDAAVFYRCTNLISITIPASVETIGADAFLGCPNLTIYCYPESFAIEYAEGNHLPYKVYVTVVYSLNGGAGTLPAALNGLSGDAVALPAQGDIRKSGCHFLGWAKTAGTLTPLSSYSMETGNSTLYAVWSMIPLVTARAGSTTVFDGQSGYIYGLSPGLTKTMFESTYVSLNGNGRFEYSPDTGSIGTGTTIEVIDNITGLAVQTYTVIIYGDLNGDGSIDSIDAGKAVDFENYMVPWDPADDALYIKAGDLNGDGSVDSIDAGIIVDAENYVVSINQVTGQT